MCRWPRSLRTGAECWGWHDWCWALRRRFRWQGSSKSTTLCRINERLLWSWWNGLHGVQVLPLCPLFLWIFVSDHIQPLFYWMHWPVIFSFQHWEGKGCSEETQGPIKEASFVQETLCVACCALLEMIWFMRTFLFGIKCRWFINT